MAKLQDRMAEEKAEQTKAAKNEKSSEPGGIQTSPGGSKQPTEPEDKPQLYTPLAEGFKGYMDGISFASEMFKRRG